MSATPRFTLFVSSRFTISLAVTLQTSLKSSDLRSSLQTNVTLRNHTTSFSLGMNTQAVTQAVTQLRSAHFCSKDYNLRYSLALSKEEKDFRTARKQKAQAKMCELLGEGRAPKTVRETPCIALMGSGGGYRALVGFTGAIAALDELGVFDCVTYTVGLSGSTW